jgi:hypothetical protein
MSQTVAAQMPAAVDYERTLVLAIEVSNKSWVLAAQVPGFPHTKAKRTIDPEAEALLAAISGYRARAAAMGRSIERVIAVYEAGWSGFWLGALAYEAWSRSARGPAFQRAGSIVEYAAQSLTVLIPSCCFGHFLLGCEASRACARWCRFPMRPMRMPDAVFANGPNSSPSASV